nr:hypothetical protein [uncultured Rhodopila sp.]
MHAPTDNQTYHMILADIAMMAAISTFDRQSVVPVGAEYLPGSIRETWLARTGDPALRSRVNAMATAGFASLQGMPATQLAAAAQTYGVPLTVSDAERMEQHFINRREAVLRYRS